MASMGASRTEIEIKLPFPSPENAVERLETIGAELVGARALEDNQVFDFPEFDLRDSGRLLRVRRFGGVGIVTFKSVSSEDPRYKVREERETAVADPGAVEEILQGLGFVRVYRYQKYRRAYRLDDVEVSVDETPIGCWVELEGERRAIDRVATRLGYAPDHYVRSNYRDLHEAWASAEGVPMGDLVFEDEDEAV